MGIKFENTSHAIDVGLTQNGGIAIAVAAKHEGIQARIEKEVNNLSPQMLEEWKTIIASIERGEELSEFHERRSSALISRLNFAFNYYFAPRLEELAQWLLNSRENTNYTYGVSDLNLTYFSQAIRLVTGNTIDEAKRWLREPLEDRELLQYLEARQSDLDSRWIADDGPQFGRRLFWYAMVRATKPKLVVETGVDKGLGSVLLSCALLHNAREGSPGRYLGTDISANAGKLLGGPYAEVGSIAYGDSIETLKMLNFPIGLFVNDSDHSAEYEAREYETIREKLTKESIILGDNAHSNTALEDFATHTGRLFTMVPEHPKEHWYPGEGVGVAYFAS
jgi:predicted O-methyltransferase YrrM